MRTTIEIREEEHRALKLLARRRGLRGVSVLVEEAIAEYLVAQEGSTVDVLLNLEGALGQDDERRMRARIDAARATWR